MLADYDYTVDVRDFSEATEDIPRSENTFATILESPEEDSPEEFCAIHDFEMYQGISEEERDISENGVPPASVMFFREARKYPLLTPDREREVAKKASSGDAKARELLINSNLRLAGHIANHLTYPGIDYDDVVQEGNLGLIRAVDKFDYSKGYRFSTYAFWWIRRQILEYIAQQGYSVKITPKARADIKLVRRAIDQFTVEHEGEVPTVDQIADMLNMRRDRVIVLMRTTTSSVSLDDPAEDKDGSRMEEVIPDQNAVSPQASVENVELVEIIQAALAPGTKLLTTRERRVLELYYGLADGIPRTYEDIGKEMGVTRQRIQHLDKKGKQKLLASKWGDQLRAIITV